MDISKSLLEGWTEGRELCRTLRESDLKLVVEGGMVWVAIASFLRRNGLGSVQEKIHRMPIGKE